MLVQRSKKRLLSEPQNKANKPNRTRDIICVGFFLWLGKTTTSPEKSHASCRLKVKQPSPDLAQLKSLYSCLSHLFRTGKSPRFPQNTVAKPAARTTDDPAAAKTQSGRRQALNCGQNRDLKLAQTSVYTRAVVRRRTTSGATNFGGDRTTATAKFTAGGKSSRRGRRGVLVDGPGEARGPLRRLRVR